MAQGRFKGGAKKRDGDSFVPLPKIVLQSAAFLSLSGHGCKLLLDFCEQYNGDNNGDLQACWKLMRPRGWKSQDTLQKAKRELSESLLIVETRKGARPNKATLYALTFYALDEMPGKLEMTAKGFPRGAWKDFALPEKEKAVMKVLRSGTSLNTPGVVAAVA